MLLAQACALVTLQGLCISGPSNQVLVVQQSDHRGCCTDATMLPVLFLLLVCTPGCWLVDRSCQPRLPGRCVCGFGNIHECVSVLTYLGQPSGMLSADSGSAIRASCACSCAVCVHTACCLYVAARSGLQSNAGVSSGLCFPASSTSTLVATLAILPVSFFFFFLFAGSVPSSRRALYLVCCCPHLDSPVQCVHTGLRLLTA